MGAPQDIDWQRIAHESAGIGAAPASEAEGEALATTDWEALGERLDLTEAAVLAEDWDRVRAEAKRVLIDNETCTRTFQYGNAIHQANIALGWAALADGDVEGAADHLRRAGGTPGSPQLDSFGPDRELATALLDRGQRDAVLAYLEACARFWEGHEELLASWCSALRRGESSRLEQSYDGDV